MRPPAARSRCSPTKLCGAAGRERSVRAAGRQAEPDARVAAWPRKLRVDVAAPLAAYVPVLRSDPGKVAADTKQYLYLDPARLLSRAASMWDPHIGMGTVTHQNIGYLFPMGPYYWVLDKLGVPDWVAERLWLGSILFFAGSACSTCCARSVCADPASSSPRSRYMFTPYTLDYSAAYLRVVVAVRRAAVDDRAHAQGACAKGGWRIPRSSRSSCR